MKLGRGRSGGCAADDTDSLGVGVQVCGAGVDGTAAEGT
jgi:hypothetical protein